MAKKLFFFLFIIINAVAYGQFYETGQDPARLHWKQISTSHFTIVFPDSYTKQAKRFAGILNHATDTIPGSLHHMPRKIPILIHSYSNMSNGLVTWAPRRMEIFPLPSQSQYGQDWLEQLALHEYRHVVQVDKLYQGTTRFFSILGGEQFTGLSAALLPQWFLEGDAVHAETAFSKTGRGRMPSFDMELRTLWLEKEKKYPFNKMLRGSYKDYVPDHYQLGYKMTAFLRANYKQDIFDEAIVNTARRPFALYPFYNNIRKNTSLRKSEMYKYTFRELEKEWSLQTPARDSFYSPRTISLEKKNAYTDYRFPQYLNDSLIIAERTGMDEAASIVMIFSDGRVKRIGRMGYTDLVRLSLVNNKLIWAEYKSHIRWDHDGYSSIVMMDVKNGERSVLSSHSKRFAPSLSPSGDRYAVIEYTSDSESRIVISDASDRQDLMDIYAPGNAQMQQPAWVNAHTLAVILQDRKGKRIAFYDLIEKSWTDFTEPTFEEFSDLSACERWVFFRAGFSGLSQIYAGSVSSGRIYQVTSDPYGAFYPSPDRRGEKIVFSKYTSKGFDLAELPIDSSHWIPVGQVVKKTVSMYETVSDREGGVLDFSNDTVINISVRTYKKPEHLFRFHSWLPFYADYDALQAGDPEVYPGVSLMSQNLLGTAFTQLAYAQKNGSPYVRSSFIYKGSFPVFELGINYGTNRYSFLYDSVTRNSSQGSEFTFLTYLPLQLSSGAWIRHILPSFYWEHRNDNYLNTSGGRSYSGTNALRYGLVAYQYLRTSIRDITPRFGQTIEVKYEHTPFEKQPFGGIAYAKAGLYLPGIMKHHSLYLAGAMQKQYLGDTRYLYYRSFLSLPKGYNSLSVEKLLKLSGSYYFPLLYPDLSLGTFFYLKRIRASAFAEYATGQGVYETIGNKRVRHNRDFASVGWELLADFHIFQIMFPLTFGIQGVYLPEEQSYGYFPVFRFDLSSF